MTEIMDNMREKGWSESEIQKTEVILAAAAQGKSQGAVLFDKVVYWSGLFLAILGNFVVSMILIPFLILMKSFYLYLSLIFLGVVFGWIFSIIIQDIESIKSGQHIIAWIFIPAIGLINIYVMANFSNHLARLMDIPTGIHLASAVSIVYVISFMMPYGLSRALKK